MSKKPYDWRDDIQLSSDWPPEQREIIERVLNYETADKDHNGKVDKRSLKHIFQDIQKFGEVKILITPADISEGSIARDAYNIKLNFEQLKTEGFGNSRTGEIKPASLNSVISHELDHAVKFIKLELLEKDPKFKSLIEARNKYEGQIEDMDHHSPEFKKTTAKMKKLAKPIIELAEKKYGLTMDDLTEMSFFREKDAMATERKSSRNRDEADRTAYALSAYLTKPLKEPIYYTNDQQKLTDFYTDKQFITLKDIEVTKNRLFNNPRYDQDSKALWGEELDKIQEHLIKKGVIKIDVSNINMTGIHLQKTDIKPEHIMNLKVTDTIPIPQKDPGTPIIKL